MTALAINSPIGLSLQGCISALARLLNFQESLSEFGAVEDDVRCTFNGIFCICFLGRRWKVASMETHKSSTICITNCGFTVPPDFTRWWSRD